MRPPGLLDTGSDCTTCEQRLVDRRSTRWALVREAVSALPDGATAEQHRTAIDARLHRHAMLRAEQQVAGRKRAEQRRAEAEARRADELRAEMLRNRPAGADLSGIRASDLLTVQNAAAEYRASALVLLARSPEADAEAELAHAAAMRSAHRHPTRGSALAAADRAAEKARTNTARHLLVRRLGAVEALRTRADQIRAAAAEQAREAVNA
ncbi:hypothetical protein ACIRYZ_36345 [Kitasatospora sp. NPDC101155]|uniref:hypothetical protein n=1 Tax=Kitasatospora sp. NPDC101155 TaxID=3364097 RepID=UPI003828405F